MPPVRVFENGEVYHVMNKSIAGYKIFNSSRDYTRVVQMFRYFSSANPLPKFSQFLEHELTKQLGFEKYFEDEFRDSKNHVQIIAFCLMPTHIHLVVKQLRRNGISTFMSNTLNSYTRYFNTKYKRKGPLWVGRFKSVLVRTDEQFYHLTRYVHLNPVTARLRDKSEDWEWSSYQEYVATQEIFYPLCQFRELLDMKPKEYQLFVEDQIDYQRELAEIKHLMLE